MGYLSSKRCQAPARSQHAPRPWALPAAARRPRAGCPGERPPPLAPQHPLPAHGRRASPRSRASRRFAHAAVYPRSLANESGDPIFRAAEVCLHPMPKAHAQWREKVASAAAVISHFAPHPQQARSQRAAPEQVLRQSREGERPLLRTIGPTASWAASAPPQRPARALPAPPRLHFVAAIQRCAAAPRASPEPLYGAMSRLGCRRGCAGAPPARRDATAAACVVSLTSSARASASQTRASPFPGAITGTAAAARAAPAAPPAPPGDAGRYPAAVATLPTAGAPPPPPPSALRP